MKDSVTLWDETMMMMNRLLIELLLGYQYISKFG